MIPPFYRPACRRDSRFFAKILFRRDHWNRIRNGFTLGGMTMSDRVPWSIGD